jgi:hypothetical protein
VRGPGVVLAALLLPNPMVKASTANATTTAATAMPTPRHTIE